MKFPIFVIIGVFTISCLIPVWVFGQQENSTQYVLKSDNNLLSGIVGQQGEYYTIETTKSGGMLYVRRDQVTAVAGSLQEAYLARVGSMTCEDVVEYLSLADWCIKYKLLDKAHDAIGLAKMRQSDYPMIPVLERRLALAEKIEQRKNDSITETTANNPGQNIDANLNHTKDLQVQQSALNQMAKNMPGDTVEQFSMEIQPMLINSCGMANCHGETSSNNFKLLRGANSRNVTLKNLYSVLRQVNGETPQESLILTKAAQAHGNLDVPVFSKSRTSAYSRLVGWTYRVTRPAKLYSVEQAAHLNDAIGASVEPISAVDNSGTSNPFGLTSFESDDSLNDVPGGNLADKKSGKTVRHAVKPGQSSDSVVRGNPTPDNYQQLDPFDPELFNKMQNNTVSESDSPLAGNNQQTLPDTNLQGGQNVSGRIEFTPDGCNQTVVPTAPSVPIQPVYSDQFGAPASSAQTTECIKHNGQTYAAPAGLPGPAHVPTPAQQLLKKAQPDIGNSANSAASQADSNNSATSGRRKQGGASAPVGNPNSGFDAAVRLDQLFGG